MDSVPMLCVRSRDITTMARHPKFVVISLGAVRHYSYRDKHPRPNRDIKLANMIICGEGTSVLACHPSLVRLADLMTPPRHILHNP
jgi:hypothetical protein